MGRVVFITGTDTGVGKTLLTVLLLRHLRQTGSRAWAMKPFATGDRRDAESIRQAQNLELTLEEINPFFFQLPVAPLVAARRAGRRIAWEQTLERIDGLRRRCELLLVEGCGGLMTPLGEHYSALDLITALRARAIVVAPDRLGVLNQMLLALKALRHNRAAPAQAVLMELETPDVSVATNHRVLAQLALPTGVVRFPWLGSGADPLAPAGGREKKLKKALASVAAFARLRALAGREVDAVGRAGGPKIV